jgi:hypothetical protein
MRAIVKMRKQEGIYNLFGLISQSSILPVFLAHNNALNHKP